MHYEVKNLIAALNPVKSVGPNSIPVKLLKILCPSLSHFLADIIIQSFQSGVFPDKLKVAKVKTIFKKGDYQQTSNYRPLSLLSIFSKIFERVMYKCLFKFLELHKILYNLQFGFQENHSIDHALVILTETIRHSLEKKDLAVVFLLIFRKPLTLSIIKSYCLRWSTMVLEVALLIALNHTFQSVNSM